MAEARPAASVVIRAKNEAALIGETLECVTTQRFRDFEVLVVDSGSTDATLDIVRRFPSVRLIEIPPAEFTFGGALNRGYGASRGDVLIALSAHAVPLTADWLGRLVGHFRDPRVAGVWGGQTPWRDRPPVPEVFEQHLGGYLRDVYRGFSNANGALRRSLWEAHPFREDLPATEDKEWAYWALRQGLVLMYDGGAAAWHYHPDTLIQTWQRAHREHAGYASIIELRPFGLLDVGRSSYWALRHYVQESATVGEALRRVRTDWPTFVMTRLGRFTGERQGRRFMRETATEPTSTRRPS
jgi:rhamnosyltransferase